MKKFVLTVCAALTMSFSVFAQTATMQKLDLSKCKILTEDGGTEMPRVIKTDLNQTKDCLFDAADGHARVFGFNVFDYRFRTNAFVDFTTDSPLNYEMMLDYGQVQGESYGFFCSTFVEGKIFAFCYRYYGPGALVPLTCGFIDPQTGDYTVSFDLTKAHKDAGLTLSDMTYDPETKLVYGCSILYKEGWSTGSSLIYSVDPFKEEDTFTEVAEVKGDLFTLSCDKGNLYSIIPIKKLDGATTKDSKLVKMPISTLKESNPQFTDVSKNTLGVKIAWAQSMEFDKINHRLWWFGQSLEDEAFFADVDLNTGKINTRKNFSPVAQVVALSIPYQHVDAKAPSYPLNLKAVRGENGARTVDLSWTNPTKDYYLNDLSTLNKIKIVRDGAIIATLDAAAIGAEQTYQDTEVPDGNHIYQIMGINESGSGVYKEVKVFIGHDLPLGPSAINIDVDENNPCRANISWTAPSIGINGGWIDKSTLKYDIVRYPDEVKIATDLTECSFVDEVDKFEGYYYVITSKNADGTGSSSKSETVVFGPKQTIPFFSSLDTKEEFNKWSVIDNNHDLVTWKFGGTENVANYDRAEGAADDYLVSPEIQFEEGKKYQVRFKYWTINWVDPVDHSPILDKMKVYYAQEPTAEAFQAEGEFLDLGEFHTPSETFLYAKQVFSVKPGKGHIAFHACSDPYRSIIYLQNVSIREYSKTDLSVTDFRGSLTVPKDAVATYGVEVTNEGSAGIQDYKVEIINADTQEVLASADGIMLRAGQKGIVYVDWTPKEECALNVTARVNLESDTYPADNIWDDPLKTKVSPAGSDMWLTINKDNSYWDEHENAYNMGWMIPFNVQEGYSEVECIYLDKEIYKKNISITGVKFMYEPLGAAEGTINVAVSAMNTDKSYFAWNQMDEAVEFIDTSDENWISLFDGDAKIGGETYNEEMVVNFTTPYYYTGGNLAFLYTYAGGGSYVGGAPMFHYHDMYDDGENERQRTGIVSRGGTLYHIPFTQFSYKEGEINGIMGVTENGLNFDVCDGKINMSQVCDKITVYSIDGKVVAEAKNASIVSLGAISGTYVIKAQAGNKTINCKVTL